MVVFLYYDSKLGFRNDLSESLSCSYVERNMVIFLYYDSKLGFSPECGEILSCSYAERNMHMFLYSDSKLGFLPHYEIPFSRSELIHSLLLL